jgi:hypothetical protein
VENIFGPEFHVIHPGIYLFYFTGHTTHQCEANKYRGSSDYFSHSFWAGSDNFERVPQHFYPATVLS